MPITLEQFGLDKLSGDEKREPLALLEQSLDAPWETPEFLAELQRRAADARANPGTGVPWEEVYRESIERCRASRVQ